MHARMAIEYFKVPQVLDGIKVIGGDGIIKIWVIYVGETSRFMYGIDSVLHHFPRIVAGFLSDRVISAYSVDVDDVSPMGWFISVIARCFLAWNEDERSVVALFGFAGEFHIQLIHGSAIVVIAEHKEIIVMIAVPVGDFAGRGVAVRIEGVGVGIAFEPVKFYFNLAV